MRDIIVVRMKSDLEKYGTAGTVLIGKQFVKMWQVTSLSNRIFLDVAKAHVVFICGKRGGGKCLSGDTVITLEDGSQAKIRDLKENKKKILCLNKGLKMQTAVHAEFFERPVHKLLQVTLRSGKTIQLTPEHPLFTVKGWVEAEKLTLGSRIAAPRVLDAFGDAHLPEHEVKLLAYLIA